MKRFFAIFIARNLEFFRDRATLIWNLLLPVFLIFGFAFAFNGNTSVYKIGTLGNTPKGSEFLNYKYLQFLPYTDSSEAMKKLSHHQIDMVIDFRSGEYTVNEQSQNGYLLEKILLSDKTLKFTRKTVTGAIIRYVDWFVPGVLGMNIMFGCLMGVGFVIVRYRQNGVLKRFKATPMRAVEFIGAQILSRFFIVILMSAVIFVGTNIFLHFRMSGSYLLLTLVTALSILCHISLGLLFSTRFKSEEVAGGVLNFLTFPMMLLSGIFFSLEGTPKVLQTVSRIFPTTHFTEAARKIMLDGAGFSGVFENIAVLSVMTVVFLFASALIFKWE